MVTQRELDLGMAALRKLRDELPFYYRQAITENLIYRCAYAVLKAADDADRS